MSEGSLSRKSHSTSWSTTSRSTTTIIPIIIVIVITTLIAITIIVIVVVVIIITTTTTMSIITRLWCGIVSANAFLLNVTLSLFFSFRLIWRNFGLSFPQVGVTNILSGPIINIYWLTHPTCEVSQDLSRHRRVGKIRIFI
jgi:hypothetical protein